MPSAHFGIQKDLFCSAADPASFVAHSSIKEVVGSLLFSQLSRRKGITLITGEPGVGKTALLSSMLEQGRAEAGGVYLSCGENWTFATLLERWSDALGIRDQVSAQEARIHAVIDFLSVRAGQGNPVSTLLLDQAENLTDDALEGLSEVSRTESGGNTLVQTILAARPEIRIRLDHPKLDKVAQGIAFHARLEPIKESEVGSYILHRLQLAGYEGPLLFTDDAIESVAHASKGIAAHVNLLCRTALQLAAGERETLVTAAIVERAVEICTKRPSDGANSSRDEAGRETGRRIEQNSLVGGQPLVDLALKERSRTADETWPMRLDIGQVGTGLLNAGLVNAGPLDGKPIVPAEGRPSPVKQSAVWKGRRFSDGPWPVAAIVAVSLMIGVGIAWVRLPADGVSQEPPNTVDHLASRVAETNSASDEPRVEPPASPPPRITQVSKGPRLVVTPAAGYEDQAIPLEIALLDLDPASTPSPPLTLSGLPPGTTLSAGQQHADGTWSLDRDDLPGLTLAAPADYSGSFVGEVTVPLGNSHGGDGLATALLAVRIGSVADTPFLGAADATGKAGQPIPLHVMAGLSDLDGSEELVVSLVGPTQRVAALGGRSRCRGRLDFGRQGTAWPDVPASGKLRRFLPGHGTGDRLGLR